jgi:membrane protease YdiL (CAAX protease family)
MMETQPPVKRSFIVNTFLSPAEPRLRAGWRLLIQTMVFIILTVCIGVVALVPYILLFGTNTTGFAFLLWGEIVQVIPLTASVFLACRFLDHRSITSIGLKLEWCSLTDIVAGIIITFVMMGLIYTGMSLMGWVKFDGFAWQADPPLTVIGNFVLVIILFIIVGWGEELLSRGYHLQTIASGLNKFWGVFLSSAIFGILHLANPNSNWISAVGIFFAGLFFAFGYLRTGQLWLPIGMHFGWNLFEGSVFGFPVSGLGVYQLTRIQVTGPDLWTGGAFGPEAGLVILPALIVGAALVALYTHKRKTVLSK